jgi:adenosylhomocysteine nucleosidase
MSDRYLVTVALEIEAQGVFEAAGVPVLYTGLGKVNAAIALASHLAQLRSRGDALPTVLNFGTAGSPVLPTHSVVACHAFVQRDMDVTGLGFAPGVTPFEDVPTRIEFTPLFKDLPQGVCGSGDRFETGPPAVACDVIDMEAYALAKACWRAGAQFGSVKYVTDGADHAAADDWKNNLPRAAAAFLEQYRRLSRRPGAA